ncbi:MULTISPECIES: hypothetical protein [unclassified Bartonella]
MQGIAILGIVNSMRAQIYTFIKHKEDSAQWIYTSREACILFTSGV